MKKYLQIPSFKAWQLYYEYTNNGKTYQELADENNTTRERIRSIVVKVQRYLYNGNVKIITEEEVKKEFEKQDTLNLEFFNVKFCKDNLK